MKKILCLVVLVALFIYGTPAVTLSESSAARFLNTLETLSLTGKSAEYCARLDDHLVVSIRDRSAPGSPRDIDGGKKEFCDYVSMAAKGMSLIGPETHFIRDNFSVQRSWLHPWTATVRYEESRTTTLTRIGVTLETKSADRWTLVQTFAGVKVISLQSDVQRAD